MPSKEELLAQVTTLGGEFRRLGMAAHVKRLRLYYLAVKHGLTTRGNDVELQWSEELVLEWMKHLRIPPFDAPESKAPRRDHRGRQR